MDSNWNPKTAFDNWFKRDQKSILNSKSISNTKTIHLYEDTDRVSLLELENTVLKAAKLVETLGADYLDIFIRAENEFEQAKKDLSMLEKIKKLATTADTDNLNFDGNLIEPEPFLLQTRTKTVALTNVFMSH